MPALCLCTNEEITRLVTLLTKWLGQIKDGSYTCIHLFTRRLHPLLLGLYEDKSFTWHAVFSVCTPPSLPPFLAVRNLGSLLSSLLLKSSHTSCSTPGFSLLPAPIQLSTLISLILLPAVPTSLLLLRIMVKRLYRDLHLIIFPQGESL